VRAYGTNNFPDCSNMCHEASDVALGHSVGVGKGTVTFDDLETKKALFHGGQGFVTIISDLQYSRKFHRKNNNLENCVQLVLLVGFQLPWASQSLKFASSSL